MYPYNRESLPSTPGYTSREQSVPCIVQEVASHLGIHPQEVSLRNVDRFITNGCHFLHGVILHPPAFLKIADLDEGKERLGREAELTKIAKHLGFNTVDVLDGPIQLQSGNRLIQLELLDEEQGVLFARNAHAANSPYAVKYASIAARTIARHLLPIVPFGIDMSHCNSDARNRSPESFWAHLDKRFAFLRTVLFNDHLYSLESLIHQMHQTIQPLILASEQNAVRYFLHNDHALVNMYLPIDSTIKEVEAKVLDFEHAGTCTNAVLGTISEFGNFYHGCWDNNFMRQAYLTTLLEESSPNRLLERYIFLKSAIVYDTVCYCGDKKGSRLQEDHDEYAVARSLLSNLGINLAFLDSEYKRLKSYSV